MRAELKRLHRQFGITIIYATPDELEALSMGDEIAVMRDGAVVQRGTPDELYDRPANLYVATKIGSPQMNIIAARRGRDAASIERPSARSVSARVGMGGGDRRRRGGRTFLLGIRPNDIRLTKTGDRALAATVHLIEPLGDVTIVSVEADGADLADGAARGAGARHAPGDTAPIVIDRGPKFIVFRQARGGDTLSRRR